LGHASSPSPPRSCNLCGENGFRLLYEKAGFSILRCGGCGLVFADPLPEEGRLRAIYGRDYFQGGLYRDYTNEVSSRRADYQKWLGWFSRRTGLAGGRWLDIGCATGSFMAAARASGWEVRGLDVSPYCLEEARALGLSVSQGTARAIPGEWGDFDAVSMWDTVEHLRDPSAEVAAAARRLRAGGWFVASTGDVSSLAARLLGRRWWFMLPPVHLYFFTRNTLEALMRKAGLLPVACRRFGRRLRLGRALRLLCGAGSTAMDRGPSLYFNALDIITVLARRAEGGPP